MKNKKKNRSSYSLSAELKNALKYLLIWGMILIFSAYLLSDSEILGNVKQQARPDTWSMIGAGGSFEEEFTCKTNRLSGVELFLSTESASVAGTFQITLYQNEREIQSWQASRLTISSGDTTYFRLDQKLTECKGQKFRIVLDGAKGDTGVAAGLVSQKDDTQTLAYRIISRPFPKSLVFLVIGAAAAVMLVIFAFLKRRQLRAEVVFAVVYIFMSICTLAAVPAFNSPDEYSHYLRSYEVSRGYLTSEGNGGNDLFSYGRTFNSGLVPEFSAKDHVSLWDIGENADQRIDREKTQFYGFGNTALYAPTSYLPQAVGIRIADLFTDRPMVLAYAGRIANMLMFGLLFFFAIRLTPVGKNFLVLLGLVPVNIQSANSMSADALALALTVALAAFVLAMRYKQKEVMSRRQLIWMYVLTGFLCLCKVVYMPFCLLLFLIPKDKEFKLRDYLREPYYTYEFKKTTELMVELRKTMNSVAIVLDEYGATAGLITSEDMLEEIVGEIRDEYDADEEDSIRKINPKEYVIEGAMKLGSQVRRLRLRRRLYYRPFRPSPAGGGGSHKRKSPVCGGYGGEKPD